METPLPVDILSLISNESDNLKNFISLIWNDIQPYYNETTRKFHTIDHIHHGILSLNKWIEISKENHLKPFQLVAWLYHDVIYDVNRNDNEEKSVELAELKIKSFSESSNYPIDEQFIKNVKTIILDTKSHTSSIDDSSVILDIDMMSLSERDFNQFLKLRYLAEEEYLMAYSKEYVLNGCIKFAESMLQKDRIFNLPIFIETEEEIARNNLTQYIEFLKKKDPNNFH